MALVCFDCLKIIEFVFYGELYYRYILKMWGAMRMAKNAAIHMTKTSISLRTNSYPAIHHTWANMYAVF